MEASEGNLNLMDRVILSSVTASLILIHFTIKYIRKATECILDIQKRQKKSISNIAVCD